MLNNDYKFNVPENTLCRYVHEPFVDAPPAVQPSINNERTFTNLINVTTPGGGTGRQTNKTLLSNGNL